VVIKGPEASAGLNPNRLSTNGVTVPIKDANTTTLNSATETTNESSFSENKRTLAPKTITARKTPLRSATENTFDNLVHNLSSINPGLERLCTISEDD
jgi:hypothetical protein